MCNIKYFLFTKGKTNKGLVGRRGRKEREEGEGGRRGKKEREEGEGGRRGRKGSRNKKEGGGGGERKVAKAGRERKG